MKQEPTIEFDQKEFLQDRRLMLLSLDVGIARAYARKWGGTVPADDGTCLWAMHMARTAAQDVPARDRLLSRRWLMAHDSYGKLR